MKGSITGRVIEWENGETMSKIDEKFSFMDYGVFASLLIISTIIGQLALFFQM